MCFQSEPSSLGNCMRSARFDVIHLGIACECDRLVRVSQRAAIRVCNLETMWVWLCVLVPTDA